MKISNEMQAAFIDEMEKISMKKEAAFMANVGNAIKSGARGFGNLMHEGWNFTGGAVTQKPTLFGRDLSRAMPVGWFGSGKQGPGVMESVMSLGGLTRYLPVGPKTMALMGAAGDIKAGVSKEDPRGLDRSRKERLLRAGVVTAAGLGSAGLTSRMMKPGAGAGALAMTAAGLAPMAVNHLFNKYETHSARKKGLLEGPTPALQVQRGGAATSMTPPLLPPGVSQR